MSADRNIFSNDFGPNTHIHQGDTINHNYGSKASRKAYFVLPFPPNEDIIRRPKIDAQLDELLLPSREGRPCSVALWGLGGSGKTQIALDYAYRRSHEDPVCDIFWVHAEDETSFTQDYKKIARKLGLDTQLNGEELLLEVCDRIESLQRWLLILDNADDVTRFGIGATDHTKSLLKFIPGGPGGTLLWTGRDEQIADLVGAPRGIQIAHMDIEEAKNLLGVTRRANVRDDEIQDAGLLLQELQWLPLAVSQAGSFMRRYPTPIKKYLSKLREGKSRWNLLKKSQHERHRKPDVSNSILEIFDISIQQVRHESEKTFKVLHAIAYVDNQNIPLAVIISASATFDQREQGRSSDEEEVLETVVTRLKEFSFISERKREVDDDPSFDMHKLVQDAIRYRLNSEDTTSETHFSSTALRVIASLFPEEIKPKTWDQCEKYANHVMQVSEWADVSRHPLRTLQFLGRAEEYFKGCHSLNKTQHIIRKELSLIEKAFGEMPVLSLLPAIGLGETYYAQQLWEEAETFALKASAISESLLGKENYITMMCYAKLATVYQFRGRGKEAEELQLSLLSLSRKIYGEKHIKTIETMASLAAMYNHLKRHDAAQEEWIKALELCHEVLGEKHNKTFVVRTGLAATYQATGQHNKEKEVKAKNFSLIESINLEEQTDIGKLKLLAVICQVERQNAKAKELYKKVFKLQKERLGEKHLETILTMRPLAFGYFYDGEFKEAEEFLLKALALLRENFASNNEWTVRFMGDLAQLYYTQCLFEEGQEYEEKALSLGREIYGDKLPSDLREKFELLAGINLPTIQEQMLQRSNGSGRHISASEFLELLPQLRQFIADQWKDHGNAHLLDPWRAG